MRALFPETLTRLQYLIRFLIWIVISMVVAALLFTDGEGVRYPGVAAVRHFRSSVSYEISVSGCPKMSGHGMVSVASFVALSADRELFHGAVIVYLATTER